MQGKMLTRTSPWGAGSKLPLCVGPFTAKIKKGKKQFKIFRAGQKMGSKKVSRETSFWFQELF